MTTDSFINKNKTSTLKKGDKVLMHGCYEATFEEYRGKVWTCQTDSYISKSNLEVVFLDGFSGCFAVQYLKTALPEFCSGQSSQKQLRGPDRKKKPINDRLML